MDLSNDKMRKYFELAEFTAERFSKDPNQKVGALFLASGSHQILSIGYNGMARGVDDSRTESWERPAKYLWVEHAERNAVYNAARSGTSLESSIGFVTLFPCADCARAMIQSGVRAAVTREPDFLNQRWGEHFRVALAMMREADVSVHFISPPLREKS